MIKKNKVSGVVRLEGGAKLRSGATSRECIGARMGSRGSNWARR